MEKYSKFKDPLTGINPFTQPRSRKITPVIFALAILRLPIYILYLLGLPLIGALIRIKTGSVKITERKGLVFCNSVTVFDRIVLKKVLGNVEFLEKKTNTGIILPSNRNTFSVFFPEQATSNNQAVLSYKSDTTPDYVVGLRYSPECVYMYGNRLIWLIRFLGSWGNMVEVSLMKGEDLSKVTGLPRVIFDNTDKERFFNLIRNQKNQK